jgi:hypothetical protein
MTTYANQTIGSYQAKSIPATAEYIEAWFDETAVKGFKFHHVGFHDAYGNYSGVHGVTVDARRIWAATLGFHCVTNIMGVAPDGREFFVTWTIDTRDGTEEFHAGDRWGKVVARKRCTGYVQEERR